MTDYWSVINAYYEIEDEFGISIDKINDFLKIKTKNERYNDLKSFLEYANNATERDALVKLLDKSNNQNKKDILREFDDDKSEHTIRYCGYCNETYNLLKNKSKRKCGLCNKYGHYYHCKHTPENCCDIKPYELNVCGICGEDFCRCIYF